MVIETELYIQEWQWQSTEQLDFVLTVGPTIPHTRYTQGSYRKCDSVDQHTGGGNDDES